MRTAKELKALALVRELEHLLLEDAPGITDRRCLLPEADAYPATQTASDMDTFQRQQAGLDQDYNRRLESWHIRTAWGRG